MTAQFKPGDLLIYKKQKQSEAPGPRAHSLAPAVQSGKFRYVVDKYWIVVDAHNDGTLEVQTRRGKRHRLHADDPNVRRANWWQRIWYRSRYRELKEEAAPA